MDSLKVSAQFAAYTWYLECKSGHENAAEATKFARTNWRTFLGQAHAGLGKLLIRLSRPSRRKASCKCPLAGQGSGIGRELELAHPSVD